MYFTHQSQLTHHGLCYSDRFIISTLTLEGKNNPGDVSGLRGYIFIMEKLC